MITEDPDAQCSRDREAKAFPKLEDHQPVLQERLGVRRRSLRSTLTFS
jgi:hypothetical protein